MAIRALGLLPVLVFTTGFPVRAGSPQAPVRSTPSLGERIDRELLKETGAGFSGAVLVAHRGAVVLDKAYGRIRGVPMRTSSRFWIASLGKQFTSAGILRGQEQGRLRLEDPLSRFFPDAPSEKKAITILQLLTHQSGLPQRYIAQGVSDRAAAVNRILSQSLESPPGTRFSYSNDNYALAAAALEIVAGRRYETFVRDELLWPAGLRHTGFAGTGPHGSVVPARDPEPSRLARRDWGSVGSGAVFSTTRDLYVWYSALSAGRVLQPASVSLLFTPYVAIGEGASGLGWFLATAGDGIRRFSRGNDSFGPNGLIYAYPEKQAVVVILSHAGQKDEDLSFSRAALASVEKLILAEP